MINQEQPGTALTAFLSAAKGYQIDISRRRSSGGGAKVMMVFCAPGKYVPIPVRLLRSMSENLVRKQPLR
jgi:hypothetical protein